MTISINSDTEYASKTVLDDFGTNGYLTTKGKGSNPTRTRHQSMRVIQDGVNNSNLGEDTTWTELAAYRGQTELNVEIDTNKLYKGLGSDIDGNDTIDDQLTKTGLDFKIESSPIRYGSKYQHRSSLKNAIYKEDGTLIDVVSDKWADNLLQPRDILQVFNQFADESKLRIEHIGAINRIAEKETALGKETCLNLSIFAVCNLNADFAVNNSDQVTGKLVLTAPYQYGEGYKVSVMAVRKVCTNGQHLPVTLKRKVLSHVTKMPEQAIKELLEGSKTLWNSYTQDIDLMAKTFLTDTEALLVLIAQYGDNTISLLAKQWLNQIESQTITVKEAESKLWLILNDTLENQPKIIQSCFSMFFNSSFIGCNDATNKTAWGLLNTVTEYYNHHQVSKNENTQINSLWYGNKANSMNSFLQEVSNRTKVKQGVIQSVGF